MPTIPARSGARRIRSLLDRLHRGWGLRLPAKPVTVDSGTSGGWSVGSAGAAGSARSGWIGGSARSGWIRGSAGTAGAESGNTGSAGTAGSARSGWIRGATRPAGTAGPKLAHAGSARSARSTRSAWPTWAGVARVGSLGTELRKTGQFNFWAVLGDGCPGLGSGGHTRTDYPEAGDY